MRKLKRVTIKEEFVALTGGVIKVILKNALNLTSSGAGSGTTTCTC